MWITIVSVLRPRETFPRRIMIPIRRMVNGERSSGPGAHNQPSNWPYQLENGPYIDVIETLGGVGIELDFSS